MNRINLELLILQDKFAICRLDPCEPIPNWAMKGGFFSITKTDDELSLVCQEDEVPKSIKSEKNWRSLKVKGPLDFGLTGILARLTAPLAQAGISIFAISTFDTDYLLIRQDRFEEALTILSQNGHKIIS